MTKCPIKSCNREVQPRLQILCRKHWQIVPNHIRNAVWDAYAIAAFPTDEFYQAAIGAVNSVMEKIASGKTNREYSKLL